MFVIDELQIRDLKDQKLERLWSRDGALGLSCNESGIPGIPRAIQFPIGILT